MSRLSALEAPFELEVGRLLASMMPEGASPIGLFRTMARNLPMTIAMRGFGAYELSKRLSVSLREREVVILRTCALCGSEYEWGVHVEVFAGKAGLTSSQIAALTHGPVGPEQGWSDREVLLIGLVDSLVTTRDLPDHLWTELSARCSDVELLDLIMLCGWYQTISQLCLALRLELEATAPRFADFIDGPSGIDKAG